MDANLQEITDGKFYTCNDMVKVGCRDCEGCSSCCQGMGESILLDPYDAWNLTTHLGMSFDKLLEGPIELHVEEGLILPNIRMTESNDKLLNNEQPKTDSGDLGQCSFLNNEGRCSIHSFRPGICRLFPLGRNYDGDTMSYFFLKDACPATGKTKVKVQKWIDTPDIKKYHQFLIDWHALTKSLRAEIVACESEEKQKQLSMIFLQLFYINPYPKDDFYSEFYARRDKLL